MWGCIRTGSNPCSRPRLDRVCCRFEGGITQSCKPYADEVKQKAVTRVTKQGIAVSHVARAVGNGANQTIAALHQRRWVTHSRQLRAYVLEF